MQPELINDWWTSTDTRIGTTDTSGITDKQKHNARKIYDYFSGLGWSLSAIAGMLGNMQAESSITPAYIEGNHRSSLPNSARNLSDVPNEVMLSFYGGSGYGIGLVQWDGQTPTPPAGQKLVSFSIRHNLDWWDGDTQLYRLQREEEENLQWQSKTIYGITWTWQQYIINSNPPEESSEIWRRCYEVGGDSSIARRRTNARYWYNYFEDVPPPEPQNGWIDGETFANLAKRYDPDTTGVNIPYSQLDCIGFVNKVWKDIPIVEQNNWDLTSGTNSLWRSTRTFNTTSSYNQHPCPELWYKDTIDNCISSFGELPPGCLLFHKISNAGPPAIPPQYANDGIGNFAHVGIYLGYDEVMQSGGRDSNTIPGGGVHRSQFDPDAWNYVAFVVWVDPTGYVPPDPDPGTEWWFLKYLLLCYNKKKGVEKNVKRTI